MKYSSAIVFLILLLGCTSPQKEIQLFDLNEQSSLLQKNNYAVMFLVPDCPLALNYTKEFQDLADSFSTQNLVFKAVVAGNQYTKKEIVTYLSNSGLHMPIWIDKNMDWCTKLKVKVSPSFYLINSKDEVLYKGALDNGVKDLGATKRITTQHYLKEAIVSWQANKNVAIESTQPIGCFLEYSR